MLNGYLDKSIPLLLSATYNNRLQATFLGTWQYDSGSGFLLFQPLIIR